jgi:hypothetical protein
MSLFPPTEPSPDDAGTDLLAGQAATLPNRSRASPRIVCWGLLVLAFVLPSKLLIHATVLHRTPAGYAATGAFVVNGVLAMAALRKHVRSKSFGGRLLIVGILCGVVGYLSFVSGFQLLRFVPGQDEQLVGSIMSVTKTDRKERGDCVLSVQTALWWITTDPAGPPRELRVVAKNPFCPTSAAKQPSVAITIRKNSFGEFILPVTRQRNLPPWKPWGYKSEE